MKNKSVLFGFVSVLLFFWMGSLLEANLISIMNKTDFTIWAGEIEAYYWRHPGGKTVFDINKIGPIAAHSTKHFNLERIHMGEGPENKNDNKITFYIAKSGEDKPDPKAIPLKFRLLTDYNSEYAQGVKNDTIWKPFGDNPQIKVHVEHTNPAPRNYNYIVTLTQEGKR